MFVDHMPDLNVAMFFIEPDDLKKGVVVVGATMLDYARRRAPFVFLISGFEETHQAYEDEDVKKFINCLLSFWKEEDRKRVLSCMLEDLKPSSSGDATIEITHAFFGCYQLMLVAAGGIQSRDGEAWVHPEILLGVKMILDEATDRFPRPDPKKREE